jgi:hypothetical protein
MVLLGKGEIKAKLTVNENDHIGLISDADSGWMMYPLSINTMTFIYMLQILKQQYTSSYDFLQFRQMMKCTEHETIHNHCTKFRRIK